MKTFFLILGLLGAMGSTAFAQGLSIPNLPPSSGTINNADLLIIEQSNVTYKITAGQAKNFFTGTSYTLPVATTTVLGGVKQGSNVTIALDGTISISGLAAVASSGSYADLTNKPVLGGTQAIASGARTASVTGLALGYTPSQVLVTVHKVSGDYTIFATVLSDTISPDGFSVDLSGITNDATYQLDYLIVK